MLNGKVSREHYSSLFFAIDATPPFICMPRKTFGKTSFCGPYNQFSFPVTMAIQIVQWIIGAVSTLTYVTPTLYVEICILDLVPIILGWCFNYCYVRCLCFRFITSYMLFIV